MAPRDNPAKLAEQCQKPASNFEILEHPADIGFRASGSTLPELFENAAFALVSIASEPGDVSPQHEYPLQAVGTDTESLLVAWLNEVLYWFDGKRISFCRFHIRTMDSRQLTAIAYGEPRDSTRHQLKITVKAVTWHQLKIEKTDKSWMAQVYLDI